MNKKVIIIVVVLIIIGTGIFFYLNREEKIETTEPKNEEIIDKEENLSFLEMLKMDSETQRAELVAVDGSGSSGTAYVLRRDGKLYHAVEASMPDPGSGNSYEGWLVQPSPLKFFSTGVMKKNEQGVWVLEYTADQEFPTHNRAVITEETMVDSTPEKHIIEGDF